MQLKQLKGIVGNISLRPEPGETYRYRLSSSIIAIIVSGAFLAGFSTPLFTVGASLDVGDSDDLFSLVFLLFGAFWMLGWSVGVLVLAVIFLSLLLGHERVVFTPGRLIVRMEVLGIGVSAYYDRDKISDYQWLEQPDARSGLSWRGPHMTFRCEGQLVSFGTNVDRAESLKLTEMFAKIVLSAPAPAREDDGNIVLPAFETVSTASGEPEAVAAPVRRSATSNRLTSASTLSLIGANCIPIAGVMLFDWRVGEVMLLFWAESAVIAFFNIAKMWVVGRWQTLLIGPFFLGHYGGFMAVHLLFIYALMIQGPADNNRIPLTEVLSDFVSLVPALAAFVISHGISYVQNFLGRREWVGRDMKTQMNEPYKRIIVMHVTLIVGGGLAMVLGSPVPALILMIVLKVGADLRSHLMEHGQV